MPILKKGSKLKTLASREKRVEVEEEEPRQKRFFKRTMSDAFEESVELYFAASMQENKAKKTKENLKPIICDKVKVDENRVGERQWEVCIKNLHVLVSTYDRLEINQDIAAVLLSKRGILERCQETVITEKKIMEAYHEDLISEKDLVKMMTKNETTSLRITPVKK